MNKSIIALLFLTSALAAKPPQKPLVPDPALGEVAAAQAAAGGPVSKCLAEAQAGGAAAVTFVRRRPPALGSDEFMANANGRLQSFVEKHGGQTASQKEK